MAQRAHIHIINRFENASGGSEYRAIELGRLLAGNASVTLWATGKPHPLLAAENDIRLMTPFCFPMRGTFVFVGVYYRVKPWIKLARPGRRIVMINTMDKDGLDRLIRQIAGGDRSRCEFRYASAETRDAIGLPGEVEESPIDLNRFQPRRQRDAAPGFVVGRLSRDTRYKFAPGDPALFASLASDGVRLRIMGGTCLAGELGEAPSVELLPANAMAADQFLSGLDCFFYRTGPGWYETFGRVVFEAMATGLPVVCQAEAGYARFIQSGENGFLFRSEAEARAQLAALQHDPELRRRVGAAARRTVEAMYGPAYLERLRAAYLS